MTASLTSSQDIITTSPSGSLTATRSTTQSATISTTSTTSKSPSSTSSWAAAFSPSSLVALRVGSAGGSLSNASAAAFLDEYSPSGALLSTRSLAGPAGLTLSGTDWMQGSLGRSADGLSLVVGGVSAPLGAAPGASAPFFSASRCIARVFSSGATSVTSFSPSLFGGLVLGVCAASGAGAWVVGNSTSPAVGLGYAADGSVDALVSLYSAATLFTGCTVARSGNLYLARTSGAYGYIDTVAAPVSTSGAVYPSAASTYFNAGPYNARQVVVNAAETRFWVSSVTAGTLNDGVYTGASLVSMTLAAATRAVGMALSADESTLYLAALSPANALYKISASCTSGCMTSLLATAAAGTELRGLALAPLPLPTITPTSTPSPTPMASASVTTTTSSTASNTSTRSNSASLSLAPTSTTTPSMTVSASILAIASSAPLPSQNPPIVTVSSLAIAQSPPSPASVNVAASIVISGGNVLALADSGTLASLGNVIASSLATALGAAAPNIACIGSGVSTNSGCVSVSVSVGSVVDVATGVTISAGPAHGRLLGGVIGSAGATVAYAAMISGIVSAQVGTLSALAASVVTQPSLGAAIAAGISADPQLKAVVGIVSCSCAFSRSGRQHCPRFERGATVRRRNCGYCSCLCGRRRCLQGVYKTRVWCCQAELGPLQPRPSYPRGDLCGTAAGELRVARLYARARRP